METVAAPGRTPWSREAKEELANALTHGFGAVLAIAGLVLLVVFASLRGTARHIVGASIFGATMVLLYVMSTLYHSFRGPRVKRVFRVLDHASIYLLIAGTYTPFCLVSLRSSLGWTIFGVEWGLAVFGVVFKSFAVDRFEVISTLVYLAQGWVAVVAVVPLIHSLGWHGLMWMGAGGLAYTLGIVFFALDRLRYFHALWHLFVLAGSVAHYFAILFYVVTARP
jgi:hemolysin III